MDWFEEASLDSVAEVMDVNLFGSYNLASAFVRQTLETRERKKIIMIGSMAHRNVLNASAMYCASKAGLAMLARCMAWELTPKGFDVYCVHPSNVDEAPMAEDTIKGIMRYRGVTRETAKEYWGAGYIREASLSTKDISDLVLFLLTEKNGYMSGANIELGGGQR
jgi:NAD(P)-dependent dehydrogenase (short-subunit alcohol dehydrogenase family)